ncbi:hypothetical protein [Pseudomonas viridiflava]|uniref:hypothetical protein n=1 Tax=Pseudomonas viridiflava TaxID=33069 RepID=UPI001F14F19D|nr:hypothetical protein [Pseudomonas viridiflava]
MSNEFKLVPVEPTEHMIAAVEGDSYTFATGDEEWIGCLSSDMAEEIYSNMLAAAPQPPALGGVPAGLDLQRIVTEALMGMIAAVTSTSPPANEPPPPFIQAGIDRAVSRISAHLVPLQAEIEHLRAGGALIVHHMNEYKQERDQLQARCDELEGASQELVCSGYLKILPEVMQQRFTSCIRDAQSDSFRSALSKPAGSEQESSLDIPSRTIKLSGCEFTEDDLLRRAVRAVGGSRRNTRPRWALVRDAFGCGSGVATALCRRFGFDPEEVLKS